MQRTLPKLVANLRRPEHTGANRCLPCTTVNVAIAAVLTAVVAAVSLPFAAGAGAASLAAIYFRGYLVPGTPALTKRYLPASVLGLFGKEQFLAPTPGEPLDVTGVLLDVGAVVDGPEDVTLAPNFEREWRTRTDETNVHAPELSELATLLDVEADALDARYHGADACTVYHDGALVGRWESPVAFSADMAAAAVLGGDPTWERLPLAHRGELLAALRVCLDTCPACGGRIDLGTETVESCCQSTAVVAATCVGCDARLFEADYHPSMAD